MMKGDGMGMQTLAKKSTFSFSWIMRQWGQCRETPILKAGNFSTSTFLLIREVNIHVQTLQLDYALFLVNYIIEQQAIIRTKLIANSFNSFIDWIENRTRVPSEFYNGNGKL